MTEFDIDRVAVGRAGEGGRPAKPRPVAPGDRDASPASAAAGRTGTGVSSGAACVPTLDPVGAPSLATLLTQARVAQAQLSAQPLPITNQSRDFILKLLGG